MRSYIVGFIKNFFNFGCSKLAFVDAHSKLSPTSRVFRFSKIIESTVGSYTYVGPRTLLIKTKVGSFCSISWNCEIGLTNHPTNFVSTSPLFYEQKNPFKLKWTSARFTVNKCVEIGNDVWIGAGVKLMAGVIVGNGAVVGAGSYVTKDIPPYAVVAGVPAKIIRYRFDPEFIKALLDCPWWDLETKYIRKNAEKLGSSINVLDYIKTFGSR